MQLRGRIAELETAAQQQQRALATARQQAESLESRLAAAELAAARSAAEVRGSGDGILRLDGSALLAWAAPTTFCRNGCRHFMTPLFPVRPGSWRRLCMRGMRWRCGWACWRQS